jgi:hypothetical protein
VSAKLLFMIRMTLGLLVILARLLFRSRLELMVENSALRRNWRSLSKGAPGASTAYGSNKATKSVRYSLK